MRSEDYVKQSREYALTSEIMMLITVADRVSFRANAWLIRAIGDRSKNCTIHPMSLFLL